MPNKLVKKKKRRSIKINFDPAKVVVTPHPDSQFVFGPLMQSTHWYRVEGAWSPQPLMATREEVERVGLHDCTRLWCGEKHAGSAEEYVRIKIIREECEKYRIEQSRKASSKAPQDANPQKASRGQGTVRGQKVVLRKKTGR